MQMNNRRTTDSELRRIRSRTEIHETLNRRRTYDWLRHDVFTDALALTATAEHKKRSNADEVAAHGVLRIEVDPQGMRSRSRI